MPVNFRGNIEWPLQRMRIGRPADNAAPGDYTRNCGAYAAAFRPASATWFAQGSTSGTIIQQFGTTGDVPVPNEFVR